MTEFPETPPSPPGGADRGPGAERKVPQAKKTSPMKRIKMFGPVVLAVLGMIVIIQNTEPVETRVLFFTITMPRAVFLLGTTLVGFALGVLVSLYLTRKKR